MKTLKIQWQRLVIDNQTCPRCGATEAEVNKAMQSLKHLFILKGLKWDRKKRAIKQADFEKNPSTSNLILIGDRPLEDWSRLAPAKFLLWTLRRRRMPNH